jgi:methyltransferase (TIGR00027 family)
MPRNPAATTAFGPMVLAAIEHNEPPDRRLTDDPLADKVLPTTLRALVWAAGWRLVRNGFIAANERVGPGTWAMMACRKRFIDDKLAAATEGTDAIEVVVILGAGLDTRGYRLAQHSDIPVFEVDQDINVARKSASVRRAVGTPPPSVHLVAVDFEHDDLMAVLDEHGYRRDARTFFIWEGVTQYLTPDAVRATLDQLRTAAPVSKLTFTYVCQDFIDGDNMYGTPWMHRRFVEGSQIWKSGLVPGEIEEFLAGYGWRLLQQAGPEYYLEHYIRPAGRTLPVSGLERTVYAEKVSQTP